jgi:multiple sugar transport system permease protein
MVTPFLFMVFNSFKSETEVFDYPPTLLPKVWDFSNYPDAWVKGKFGHYFLNTVFIAVSSTFLVLATSTLAGYAFARLEFPGRDLLLLLLLSTMMLPGQITLIPRFVLIKRMPLAGGNNLLGEGGTGWISTYQGLIIPGAISVWGIFMLRQFMQTIPNDLSDAARIDGCSEFRIFWEVIVPLVGPALATLTIFTFQGSWNTFMWPLLVGRKKQFWTLQVALAIMRTGVGTLIEWPELLAGTLITILPVLVIFVFAQKYFVRGIALTGFK